MGRGAFLVVWPYSSLPTHSYSMYPCFGEAIPVRKALRRSERVGSVLQTPQGRCRCKEEGWIVFSGHLESFWARKGSEGWDFVDFGGLESRISCGRALEVERSRGGVFDQESRTGSLSLVLRVLFSGQKERRKIKDANRKGNGMRGNGKGKEEVR